MIEKQGKTRKKLVCYGSPKCLGQNASPERRFLGLNTSGDSDKHWQVPALASVLKALTNPTVRKAGDVCLTWHFPD